MEERKHLPEHRFSSVDPDPRGTRITWEFRSSANAGDPPRPTESEILRWSLATCTFQEFHAILMCLEA